MRRDEIAGLLPDVFQRTLRDESPLRAILEVMEALHQPSEEILAGVEDTFNPYRCDERFLPMLARWLDLDRFFPAPPLADGTGGERMLSTGPGRLRELIAASAYLSQWRGTAHGLRRFLETATGAQGFELIEDPPDADGVPRPFYLLVRVPRRVARCRDLIERIIEQEKPAYVRYEIEVF